MPQTYTFASWNVNGLRAVLKKDPSFIQIAQELDVDILALQETKLQGGQVDIDLPGYYQTWSYAERKGYSGTAVFSRQEPLRVLRADALLPYAGEGEASRNRGPRLRARVRQVLVCRRLHAQRPK